MWVHATEEKEEIIKQNGQPKKVEIPTNLLKKGSA